MKKGFRIFLLLVVAFAIYGGVVSGQWLFPAWMMVFCFICYLLTYDLISKTLAALTDLLGMGGNK